MNTISQDIMLIVIARLIELVLLLCHNALITDPKAHIPNLVNIFLF